MPQIKLTDWCGDELTVHLTDGDEKQLFFDINRGNGTHAAIVELEFDQAEELLEFLDEAVTNARNS